MIFLAFDVIPRHMLEAGNASQLISRKQLKVWVMGPTVIVQQVKIFWKYFSLPFQLGANKSCVIGVKLGPQKTEKEKYYKLDVGGKICLSDDEGSTLWELKAENLLETQVLKRKRSETIDLSSDGTQHFPWTSTWPF